MTDRQTDGHPWKNKMCPNPEGGRHNECLNQKVHGKQQDLKKTSTDLKQVEKCGLG